MHVTPEIQRAIRERRKKVWIDHACNGISLRDLAKRYRASETAMRKDMVEWAKVIARTAQTLGLPYLEVVLKVTSVTWQRHPRVLRLSQNGRIKEELLVVNWPLGFDLLTALLKEQGVAMEQYPFNPDNFPLVPGSAPTSPSGRVASPLRYLEPTQVINTYKVKDYLLRCAKVRDEYLIFVTFHHAMIFSRQLPLSTSPLQIEDLFLDLCKEAAIYAYKSLDTMHRESPEIVHAFNQVLRQRT